MGEERGHVGRWKLGQAWERHADGTGEGSAEEGSPSWSHLILSSCCCSLRILILGHLHSHLHTCLYFPGLHQELIKRKLPRSFANVKKWGIIYMFFLNFCCLDHYEKLCPQIGCSWQERCDDYLRSLHQSQRGGSALVFAGLRLTPHRPLFQCNSIQLHSFANPRKLPSSSNEAFITHPFHTESTARPLSCTFISQPHPSLAFVLL